MISVFVNYYEESHPARKAEIDRCVLENCNNKNINYVLIKSNTKMKYSDFFRYINEYTNEEDINIVSNLDIYFDDTILLTKKITKEHFICLLRYDMVGNNVRFYNRQDSQDVWGW